MIDKKKIERAARMILEAIGEDPRREGLKDTPRRVARYYAEICDGIHKDPSETMRPLFHEKYNEVVLVKDIAFCSICEHHLLPFLGTAHVAYIPNGKVIGISKIARVVDLYAHRPQVQERLANQIADHLAGATAAKAVAVVLEATHTCMTIRGIKKPGSKVITSAIRGLFLTNSASRAEVMSLIHS